jgi:hypothetical protein
VPPQTVGSINGYKEIGLIYICAQFGNVDMEIANRLAFEFLSLQLVTFHIWQSRYPMPLQTAMQRRTRQMWDGWPLGCNG